MKKIVKGFSIVLIMTLLSKIASFLSEVIIAYLLGTSNKADEYSIIIGIHQIIYPMLGVGVWSVFLPYYKKKLVNSNKKDAIRLLNKVINLFLIISLVLIIIINLFAPQIIMVVANGFSNEMKNICTSLLRIYSPYFLFVIISSIYAAVLQAEEKFFASQIREVVTYIPIIILGPIMYNLYDLNGLMITLVLGSIFRLIVLLPFLDKTYKYKSDFSFKDKDIKEIMVRIPSVLVTSGIEQVNTLIDKVMASNLAVGSVSSLSYGNKLINVFNGLFSSAISTTLYPTMSQYVAEKKTKELKNLFTSGLVIMAIAIVPLSTLAILLRTEIVTIVFARGKFDASSISVTSMTFMGYLIGMYFVGVKQFMNNVFYSYGETKETMKISIIVITVNILLNIVLTKYYGVMGLAIATSISSILYFILSLIKIKSKLKIDIKDVLLPIIKIYIISIVAYIVSYILYKNININNYIIKSIIISTIYIITYGIQLLIINIKEKEIIRKFLINRRSKIKNEKK